MSHVLSEHDRMIAGMVKECYVVALDLTARPPVCRVSDGEWVSAWLRWHSQAAGKARHWRVPSMGEQGTLLSPSGDVSQGTFVPGLFGDAGPAPDNRDHVERWLTVTALCCRLAWWISRSAATVTDSAVVVTSGAIALDDVTIYGEVLINRGLRVTGDINGGGAISTSVATRLTTSIEGVRVSFMNQLCSHDSPWQI